ncbi:MAG: xanthine dehydrogenase family protein molybdopterin-binding subunit [Solirubrobacterales bacterium]|nr:xanthine dehydrogenase family protein molybdopterin-binding subunit [Solirubrobacterales bacterium]
MTIEQHPPAARIADDTALREAGRRWIGKSLNRVEDPRFLRGEGRYIDDITLPGMAHAAIVRSPHAHARIVSVDTSKAERLAGVVRVLTGADVAARAGPLPSFGAGPIIQDMIATEKVRHYGEAVAAVIAEDRYIAEDACDLIEVEYEELPVVLDPFEARKEGSPLVHEKLGTNVAYERTFTFGEVERAFAQAPRKVRARLRWPRSTGMPMDMNGAIGDYDAGTGVLTIYANSMNFTYFLWLIAVTLKIPASRLKIVPVAAGGSFGSKFFMHKVPTFAGFLSMVAGRPVKYVEDRITHIVNNDHCGSDRHYDAELAFDDDGTFRALRIDCVDDYGAYLQFGTGTHGNALSQIVGPYRIREVEYSLHAVLTNKNQQGAYRGFGAECSNWVLERLVDFAARDLGLDRVEIRRRNLIGPDEFPYRTPTGNIYDSGNYQGVLKKVLETVDYDHWVAERERARADGRHVGIGVVASNERSVFSTTEFWFWFDQPEFTPTASPESASIQIDPTGQIVVTLHSQSLWGNSPETVVSQVVAEEFDVDPASVVVTYADSQHALPGTGPGGSRYTVMVAGAVAGAASEVKEKIRRIAADKLEASETDLVFREGGVSVIGSPDRKLTLGEIALSAYMFRLDLPPDMESGLAAQSTYDHPLTTLPSDDRSDLGIFYPFVGHAWHIAVVEVDVETGKLSFLRYAAVHDAGTIVNPKTLDGQVIGGTIQGLGTALYEQYLYDEKGRVRNPTFEYYHLPSSMDVPTIAVGHQETPSPYTPYGIKGAGEGGRMLTPAILSAAIEDALSPYDVRVTALPITAEQIVAWAAPARRPH